MKINRIVSIAAGLGLTLVGLAAVNTAHAQNSNMIVVIDQSGSMSGAGASDGTTKWEIAIQRAKDIVDAPHPDREYELWTFDGSSWERHFSFADGAGLSVGNRQTQVLAAIDSLPGPGGQTPLAMTVCDAVDSLAAHEATVFPFPTKHIELFSDGLENATPTTHPCYGPNSAIEYDRNVAPRGGLEVNSWQWKVLNKAITGDPSSTGNPPPDLQVIFDVQTLFDYIPTASGFGTEEYVRAVQPNAEGGNNYAAVATSGTFAPGDLAFFEGLAEQTGGNYMPVDPQLPPPVFGDITQDRCVSYPDYQQIIQYYGQPVSSPESNEADLNRDGFVDYADYLLVIQNYGQGGGC